MPAIQKISQITLPDGSTYYLEDQTVGISDTYDENTQTLILLVGSLDDADGTEY